MTISILVINNLRKALQVYMTLVLKKEKKYRILSWDSHIKMPVTL